MRKLKSHREGFTLVELLLVVAIGGLISAALVPVTFQLFRHTELSNIRVNALLQIEKAARSLSNDVQMAQSAQEDSGILTLSWTDWTDWSGGEGYASWNDFVSHTITYSLVGNDLKRTYDSTTATVARHISSISFSVPDNKIIASITASPQGSAWVTVNRTYRISLRAVSEDPRK